MERNNLKEILLANFKPVSGVNFSKEQISTATRNAIIDFFEIKDLTPREIRAKRPEIMALIEEVIDEIMPLKLNEKVEQFAEVKAFGRNDEVVFDIKNRGKRRAWLSIKKGQRGGMYQAARLDDSQFALNTWTETVGVFVTLEEILLGKYNLMDLMNNILDGFEERLYVEVIEALQTAANYAPAANVAAANGIVPTDLDPVIRIVSAYGSPMIFGFHNVISKFTNNTLPINTYTPNVPASDLEEIKRNGYVGLYKGTPVVKLPNYIVNENTNADWLLDESFLFVIPAGVKPVKVALKGDLTIIDVPHPTGSMEQNAHKMVGVGMLLTNNIGLYEDQDE